jgi:hypothetical protein
MNFAFRALTALHQFLAPDLYKQGIFAADEDLMSKSFCNDCYSSTCRHCIPQKNITTIPVGESIENIMSNSQKMSDVTSGVKRTILPPPPPTDPIDINKEGNGVIAKANSIIVEADADEFFSCHFCQTKVKGEYLTQHLNAHTHHNDFTQVKPTQTTALATISVSAASTPLLARSNFSEPKCKIPALKSVEHYKFRNIDTACAASSVDQSGRFSDFTVFFFLQEKTSVTDASWRGGGISSSKDQERFIVHIAYDSLEDYFMVSMKISKRSSYSTYDIEDAAPDRICLQKELMTDIKRSLLFFGIPPKVSYKIFRKLFIKNNVNIEYDAAGRACMSETSNSEELNKKLNTKIEYSSYHGYDS